MFGSKTMLTLAEFKTAATRYRRRALISAAACFAPVLLVLGALGYWKPSLENVSRSWFGEIENAFAGLVSVVLFPCIGVTFLAMWAFERSSLLQDPRLNCPTCGRMLALSQDVVIASRHCPHCGSQVLNTASDYAEQGNAADSR